MKSIPFSIRLPENLASTVEWIAKKTGKSAPDVVRSGIEQAFADEYRSQVIDCISNPANTMRVVREFLSASPEKKGRAMPLPFYSALMYFWHTAYMQSNGFANPEYVDALLSITSCLLTEAEENNLDVNFRYCRDKLGIRSEEAITDGIKRINAEFQSSPSIGYAEWLARPLVVIADDLQKFESGSIGRIFDRYLQLLLPVAVIGSKTALDEDIVSRDLKVLLPSAEPLTLGGLSVRLFPDPLGFIVEEGHHCYFFGHDSLLGFYAGIQHNAFEILRDGEFKSRGFEVQDNGKCLNNGTGYRLILSVEEFKELTDYMRRILSLPGWQWLIQRHRELRGDI